MPNNRFPVFSFVALLAFVLSLSSCSPRPFDADAEGAKLLKIDAEWADLASDGKDVEKIISYWSDDATLMFPGQPIIKGKAALRAYVTESVKMPGFKIHWKSEKPVFSPDGNMAYMPGTDEVTMPGPKGALRPCIIAVSPSGGMIRTANGAAWLISPTRSRRPPQPQSSPHLL